MAEGMIWIHITPISKQYVLSVNIQVVVFVYLIFEFPVKLNHSHDMWYVYDLYDFSIKNISDNGNYLQLLANITGLIFV